MFEKTQLTPLLNQVAEAWRFKKEKKGLNIRTKWENVGGVGDTLPSLSHHAWNALEQEPELTTVQRTGG